MLPGAKFSLRQSLAFSYIATVTLCAGLRSSVTHGIGSVTDFPELSCDLNNSMIIRPHRSATYVDAAYLRPSSVVCRSVTLESSATTAEPIEMPFWLWTRVGPRNHVLDGVQITPYIRAILRVGKGASHCKV